MKQRMADDVARYRKWDRLALEQRIVWRESVMRQTDHELAALREALRQQEEGANEHAVEQ